MQGRVSRCTCDRSDMEPTDSSIGDAMTSASALIAEPVLADALLLVATVSSLGFHVTVADNFHDAQERLRVPPVLLIADIRLGEYNGLHLVLRGKSARRNLAAIVTSAIEDGVLQSDAEQMGATFMIKPVSAKELRAAIGRTLLRSSDSPVRAPFERRKSERRASADRPYQPDRRGPDRRRDLDLIIHQVASAG